MFMAMFTSIITRWFRKLETPSFRMAGITSGRRRRSFRLREKALNRGK